MLVLGVESDPAALGFFGYAYYALNSSRLKAVAVDAGGGCVAPDAATIVSNAYAPLSRPLFIYVSTRSLASKPRLADFVAFYLAAENRDYIDETGYVAYADDVYAAVAARFAARRTGSAFADFQPGDSVLDALEADE